MGKMGYDVSDWPANAEWNDSVTWSPNMSLRESRWQGGLACVLNHDRVGHEKVSCNNQLHI
jgi:hypothetical protein